MTTLSVSSSPQRQDFDAVEFWNAADKDLDALGAAARRAGVAVNDFSAEPGVDLTDPANHDAFLSGLAASRDRAVKLGAPILLYVAGNALPGVPRAEQHAAIVTALRRAADVLAGSGVILALEPINTGERPNTFLPLTPEALDIVDEVGRPEVKLLYDMYHSAVMGEHMTDVLAGRVDRIAHVHLADHPGRHEPGTGGVPWRENLAWLRANGYRGRVGLEFKPTWHRSRACASSTDRARSSRRSHICCVNGQCCRIHARRAAILPRVDC